MDPNNLPPLFQRYYISYREKMLQKQIDQLRQAHNLLLQKLDESIITFDEVSQSKKIFNKENYMNDLKGIYGRIYSMESSCVLTKY